jgi:hypothetical protein
MDVAITWSGAAGCAVYLWTLYRYGHRGVGAQRFLICVLTGLLFVRGFEWLTGSELLDRLTLAIATWLPLAITLFIERVLRRHHPLWVKLLALGTSSVFFVADISTGMSSSPTWMVAFAGLLALCVVINGVLLLGRRRSELGAGENRLASLLILLAFVSAVLVLTDFRTPTGFGFVRMGAIAALLFVYAMLGAAIHSAPVIVWAGRFVLLLVFAAALSALIALATHGQSLEGWLTATLAAWPVSYAWMLLTGIVVNRRELSTENDTNNFLRWLMQVRVDSAEGFFESLIRAPDAATHALLGAQDLADYDMEQLTRFASASAGVVSLTQARRIRSSQGDSMTESAEQWVDLLEKTQMTHGFPVRHRPPALFLLNLPVTTSSDAAEMRLRVMQHISRQVERVTP